VTQYHSCDFHGATALKLLSSSFVSPRNKSVSLMQLLFQRFRLLRRRKMIEGLACITESAHSQSGIRSGARTKDTVMATASQPTNDQPTLPPARDADPLAGVGTAIAKKHGATLDVAPTTSVTVTQVIKNMSVRMLDALICSRYDSAKRLHGAFNRRISELLPALVEMEARYKRPGTRTDLTKTLKEPTFYKYLESRNINPGTFRVLRRRAALKQLEDMTTKPVDAAAAAAARRRASASKHPHKNGDVRIESESGATMLAKAGIRLAKALTNLLQPERERYTQAVRLAEGLLEAAESGNYEIVEPPLDRAERPKPVTVFIPKCHQKVIQEQAEPDPDEGLKREASKSFENAIVEEIEYATAKPIIEKSEWMKNCGAGTRHYFALKFGEHIAAIECFGSTHGTNVGLSAVGKEFADRVCTLTRGCKLRWAPENSASYLISRACKEMTKKGKNVFVAYATEEAGELGCVYQSVNWIYTGKTATPTMYRAPDGTLSDSRMVNQLCRDARGHKPGDATRYKCSRSEMKAILEELGYKAERGSPKHRYVGLVGSTTLVKKLRKALRWRSLPYLKREIAE
jgi:hypothetical protein